MAGEGPVGEERAQGSRAFDRHAILGGRAGDAGSAAERTEKQSGDHRYGFHRAGQVFTLRRHPTG